MRYPILSQAPPSPYGSVVSPKPDYGAFVSLWLEFLKNCPCGRAEVFCPFDWHVRSRALRGSLRERRGGDKSWHQTLLFASDKSVCFVRNKQEWFCTNSWLIRTPATLSKFWKRVQNPTTFGGSLKKIGLALFLVIHRLWLLKAIGFCFLSIDFWYILFQSNVTKVSY